MRKPISTKMHAIMDLMTAGMALVLPRVMNCSDRLRNGVTAMALTKLAYGLMTRHELGLVKKIPMKTHLVLDTISGASMAALPFMVDEEDPQAITCCVAMGMLDVAAAPLTQTHSPLERQHGSSSDQGSGLFRRAVARGRSAILS
jgi:hypothetical protein